MKTVTEAINYRRSVRKYDPEVEIDDQVIVECIKEATLAPNSSNMQLWEFYHVTSKEKLEALTKACFNQNAAKTAQQMLVIVVRKDLWKKRAKSNADYLKTSFGKKNASEYSPREKNRLKYYEKTMPFVYADIFGVFGLLKKVIVTCIGLFKPIYRQVKGSDMRIVAHKSAALAAENFMLSMAARGYDTCPMEGFDSKLVKKAIQLPYSSEINMIISCGVRIPKEIYGERFRIPFEEVYYKK